MGQKNVPQISLPGQETSCGATPLDAFASPLAYFIRRPLTWVIRLTYSAKAFQLALQGPFELILAYRAFTVRGSLKVDF